MTAHSARIGGSLIERVGLTSGHTGRVGVRGARGSRVGGGAFRAVELLVVLVVTWGALHAL